MKKIYFVPLLLLINIVVVAQPLTNNASTPQQKPEVNIDEVLPSSHFLNMTMAAIEYADKLSKNEDVQKFTDSTGCAVRVSGFYNHVVKQGDQPNSVTTALMEGIKIFFGKDVGTTNQPRIGVDILWVGLNDGGEDYVSAKTRVSTQMEATTTVGTHFLEEPVQTFASSIKNYTDTSLNIIDSQSRQIRY